MSRGMHNLTNGAELSPRWMRNTAEYDYFPLIFRRNRVGGSCAVGGHNDVLEDDTGIAVD